ncbi:MAG: hypothetical protein HYU66_18385 [Armatimonadetes bacterium]|nr:hypothetical protein [Armatimonadota bacterium]
MLPPLLALFGPLASEPRPEPPRPDLERTGFTQVLHGAWDFCFDPAGDGHVRGLQSPGAAGFDRTITVPYPWESRLSGAAETGYRGVAWYRRTFRTPEHERGYRVHLCFGAVDWACRVWVNGREVGGHEGGYTPFRLDVTDALAAVDNTLVVRVLDETDPDLPTGKQVHWYTTTSGIWQPVWLERVAPTYVEALAVDCDLAAPAAHITATIVAPSPGRARVSVQPEPEHLKPVSQEVELVAGANEVRLTLPVPGGKLWTPEDPQLHTYALVVERDGLKDGVYSYFGLRTIGRGVANGQDHESILLNGKPVYLRGALHQVFNPEGIYTFGTDREIRRDLEIAKEVGWNYLRLHIKVVDPRFLYWADHLGVLLMCDMPNTWGYTPRGRDAWEQTLREAVHRDRAHPSIIAWCDFNETWGLGRLREEPANQAWVAAMYHLTKQLDPTRLVEDNSACNYDHVVSDLNSWHFYIDNYEAARDHIRGVIDQVAPRSGFNYCPGWQQDTAPLMNSEYGGVSAGGGDRDVSWCFKYLTTLLRAEGKCQGYIYTEHCDIEWEHNGLVCYDRTPKVFGYDAFVPGMTVADLQGADFVGTTGPPTINWGQTVVFDPFISHYSALDAVPTLRWRVVGWDTLGQPVQGAEGTVDATWSPAAVTHQPPLTVPLPANLAIGAVGFELHHGGRKVAANYVNVVHLGADRLPAAAALDARRVALRFRPGAIAAAHAPDAPGLLATLDGDKLAAPGKPSFTWHLRLPEPLRGTRFDRLALLLEAGARGGDAKLDWPARRSPQDYPQTKQGRATPSTLSAELDRVPIGTAALADDWADARGVLSHVAYRDHGSFGERVSLTLDLAAQPALAEKLSKGETVALTLRVPDDATDAAGLSIYGERMGRYVLPPTILLEAAALPVPAGWTSAEPVTTDELGSRREKLVPTAEDGGATWRYTTAQPPAGWERPEFDDAGWREGKSSFGAQGTPGALIGTAWQTGDIWLRRGFELGKAPAGLDAVILRVNHDEDCEVYLNGERVLALRGYHNQYEDHVLPPEAVGRLKAGGNVIAVHCHQTVGGQNVDVGVAIIRE